MSDALEFIVERKGNPVPVMRGLAVIGNMLDFQRDRLGFVMNAARYGKVVKYPLANIAFYQINHPDGIKHVLQDNNHNYIKGELFDVVREVADGLFTMEGTSWLRQRRMMQPVFHRQNISGFGSLFTEGTGQMLDRWSPLAVSGEAFDISRKLTRLTLEIVTCALFGSAVVDDKNTIGQSVTTALNHLSYRFDVPFYPPLRVPTIRNLKVQTAIRNLDKIIYELIRDRQDQSEGAGDLLSVLIHARVDEDGSGMTLRQLRNEVMTFFIAGHETTAVLLSWVFSLLGNHPEVEQRLYAEIETVLHGRIPRVEDYPNLTYTRMVLNETLRLYPPAWITNRTVISEDEICGYYIPAGATIAVSPYVIHHHPDFWEAPEKFDPDRFSPDQVTRRLHYVHFPFGGGPRKCIGSDFAMLEASLVLATMLQRYRFRLAPGQNFLPDPKATLRPRDGVWVQIRPNSGQR